MLLGNCKGIHKNKHGSRSPFELRHPPVSKQAVVIFTNGEAAMEAEAALKLTDFWKPARIGPVLGSARVSSEVQT